MEKIRNIQDLKIEQDRLRRRKNELSELMYADWIEIKNAARWKNILLRAFSFQPRNTKSGRSSWMDYVVNTVHAVAGYAVRQAEDKIETKLSEKLAAWVYNVFRTKRKRQASKDSN